MNVIALPAVVLALSLREPDRGSMVLTLPDSNADQARCGGLCASWRRFEGRP